MNFNEHEFSMKFTPVHMHTHTRVQKCFFPESLRAEFPAKVNRRIPSPGWMKFPCHVVFSTSRPTIPLLLLLFQTPSLPLSLYLSQSRRPPSFPFFHTHCSPEFHSDSSVSVNVVNISASCILRVIFQLPAQRPPDMGYKEKHSSSMHLHTALRSPFTSSDFFELFWIGKQTLQENLPFLFLPSFFEFFFYLNAISLTQKDPLQTVEYSNKTVFYGFSSDVYAWTRERTEYIGWVWVQLNDDHVVIVIVD